MAELPEYLTEQTYEAILQRMLDTLPADISKSEGDYVWDSLAPAAIELALSAVWAQQVLARGFASTTFGEYLDLRSEEHGIIRIAAIKATGEVTFTGEMGVNIPIGTQVSAVSDGINPAIFFITKNAATVGSGGTVIVGIEAIEAGNNGNVAAGTISMMQPVPGITAVTNVNATIGGAEKEDDTSLLTRYLQRVRYPSAGGNKADYVNWSLECPGVGRVSVVPVRDGPGTVSISIVDLNLDPASQPLIDVVQNYIAPPWKDLKEAEDMSISGYGVSVDTTQEDDYGDSVKIVYSASGEGVLKHLSIHNELQQSGIWQLRLRIKVDDNTGTNNLLQVGAWDTTADAWLKTTPGGATDAVITLKANDLLTTFGDKTLEFYWDGIKQVEIRITRLTADTTTIVWVDRGWYISTFSTDMGDGKAPVGARVTVEAAQPISINVSVDIDLISGYVREDVREVIKNNIKAYLKTLIFTDDNDVRYVRIGEAILDTAGVKDFMNLLVNGGTSNIVIGPQQIAVPGNLNIN